MYFEPDQYAHRLRAIGHLHEAEDESQEWSELHTAIREARKAYQWEGVMPDFERLSVIARSRVQNAGLRDRITKKIG